jgi:hypothetical protein
LFLGEPKPQVPSEGWGIVSLLLVGEDIWAGTNTGALLIINAKVFHV